MYVHRMCEGTRVEARGTAVELLLFYILWVLGIELPSLGFSIKCFYNCQRLFNHKVRD